MGPLLLVIATLAACGEPGSSDRGASADPWEGRAAEEALAAVEQELLEADGRRLAFEVEASGGFSAALRGELHLHRGNALELHASGTFGADSIAPWLHAEGDHMAWGSGNEDFRDSIPPGLREAMLIGLTRMGILHNLARLVSGAPPDRADGSVRSWLEVENPTWADADADTEMMIEAEARGRSDVRGISFDLRVAGQRAARATVWLDSEGRMIGRDQVVEFPGGAMRVTERYRWRGAVSR